MDQHEILGIVHDGFIPLTAQLLPTITTMEIIDPPEFDDLASSEALLASCPKDLMGKGQASSIAELVEQLPVMPDSVTR